jgi:hypothetical protein
VKYLLILLGLAVVIAPLVSAMPSRSQRARAALRDQARALKLRVSVRPLPDVPARFRFSSDRELVCYSRLLPKSSSAVHPEQLFVRVADGWAITQGLAEPPAWLSQLPKGVSLVLLSDHAVSFFWDESEGVDGLRQIADTTVFPA